MSLSLFFIFALFLSSHCLSKEQIAPQVWLLLLSTYSSISHKKFHSHISHLASPQVDAESSAVTWPSPVAKHRQGKREKRRKKREMPVDHKVREGAIDEPRWRHATLAKSKSSCFYQAPHSVSLLLRLVSYSLLLLFFSTWTKGQLRPIL